MSSTASPCLSQPCARFEAPGTATVIPAGSPLEAHWQARATPRGVVRIHSSRVLQYSGLQFPLLDFRSPLHPGHAKLKPFFFLSCIINAKSLREYQRLVSNYLPDPALDRSHLDLPSGCCCRKHSQLSIAHVNSGQLPPRRPSRHLEVFGHGGLLGCLPQHSYARPRWTPPPSPPIHRLHEPPPPNLARHDRTHLMTPTPPLANVGERRAPATAWLRCATNPVPSISPAPRRR